MTILYALIARGKTVLAEYTFTSGNFPTITRVILGRIPEENGKMSYVYDQFAFHYICEDKLIYLCMCDDMSKRRIPFAFLEDISQRFKSAYGSQAHTAIAFAMNEDFGRTLNKQIDFYNGPSADNFSQVSNKLEDVKNIMVENIEKILERGEKLELLVDKTDQLQQQAFKFEKSSRKLKNEMFYRRIKFYLAIAFVIALLVVLPFLDLQSYVDDA
eukprot:gene11053-23109_t